jgi:hypothetical protein
VVRQATIPDEVLPGVIEKPALKGIEPAIGLKGRSSSRKELPVIRQILIVISVLVIARLLLWYSLTPHGPEQPANSSTQTSSETQPQPE